MVMDAAGNVAKQIAQRLLPSGEAGPVVWQVTRAVTGRNVQEEDAQLDLLLAGGWVPWGITPRVDGGYVYHLKRVTPTETG